MCAKNCVRILKKEKHRQLRMFVILWKKWKNLASSTINQASVKSQKQCVYPGIMPLWQKVYVCSAINIKSPSFSTIEHFGDIIHNIHNWPLQPFSQDYSLASHTTHVVCVNFIREWRDIQFNVDSERQIFEKLFHGNFIYSQSFCQKSAVRKSPKKYFSYFIFLMTDLGYEPRLLRLINRHTTY